MAAEVRSREESKMGTSFAITAKKNIENLKAEGNQEFRSHRFSHAVKLYTDAIEACSDHTTSQLEALYCNRAFSHVKMENFGSAILDAEMAIELNRNSSKAYYRRGCAYLCLMKYLQAKKDFEVVYKLTQDQNAAARIKECQKQLRQQKFAEAIATEQTMAPSQTADPEAIIVDPSYAGPAYDRECFKASDFQKILDYIKVPGNILHKRYAYMIVMDMIRLLEQHSTLTRIEVPQDGEFTVCGDVHGQFYDLLNIFKLNGLPSEENPYLFNGDFIDRGSFSVECIVTLFAAKLLYPGHVHLARGNHETRNMNKLYGFEGEVTSKYDAKLYTLFCEAFCMLPLAHVINDKIFVVHGGLFSNDGVLLSDIEALDRVREPPDDGIMCEMLWSDPQPFAGRAASKRGVGCSFGPDVTARFLEKNDLSLIIRSHEMKEDGFEVEHNGKLVTVFSAPNYCDQMGNKGAFVRLNGTDLKPRFTSFEAVEHPNIQAMAYANPMLGLLQ